MNTLHNPERALSHAQYRITVNGSCPLGWVNDYPEEQWKEIAEHSDNRSISATLERRCLFPDTEESRMLFPNAMIIRATPWGIVTKPTIIAAIES